MRTPKNIVRHELIGLDCEVVEADNESHVGVSGKVRDETMKTLVIGEKRVPKKGSVFRFRLDAGEVDVDGDVITARPEDRIKKKFKKW